MFVNTLNDYKITLIGMYTKYTTDSVVISGRNPISNINWNVYEVHYR